MLRNILPNTMSDTLRRPLVNIRLLGTRQFGMCFVMMLVTGGVIFSSIQLLPQLVQEGIRLRQRLA